MKEAFSKVSNLFGRRELEVVGSNPALFSNGLFDELLSLGLDGYDESRLYPVLSQRGQLDSLKHYQGLKKLVKDFKSRRCVLVVGNTGAGKSTFIAAAMGNTMRKGDDDESLKVASKPLPNSPLIGTSPVGSETVFPQFHLGGSAVDGLGLIDTPGFFDTRGEEWSAVAGLLTQYVICKATLVGFFCVLPKSSFWDSKCEKVLELMTLLYKFCPEIGKLRLALIVSRAGSCSSDALKNRLSDIVAALEKEKEKEKEWKHEQYASTRDYLEFLRFCMKGPIFMFGDSVPQIGRVWNGLQDKEQLSALADSKSLMRLRDLLWGAVHGILRQVDEVERARSELSYCKQVYESLQKERDLLEKQRREFETSRKESYPENVSGFKKALDTRNVELATIEKELVMLKAKLDEFERQRVPFLSEEPSKAAFWSDRCCIPSWTQKYYTFKYPGNIPISSYDLEFNERKNAVERQTIDLDQGILEIVVTNKRKVKYYRLECSIQVFVGRRIFRKVVKWLAV